MTGHSPLTVRVLAVLAAIFFVIACSIGLLLPPLTSLGGVISMIDHDMLVGLQNGVRATLSDWTWRNVFVPVLVRPAWFPAIGLSLVFGGIAMTLSSRRGVPGSPRWRN